MTEKSPLNTPYFTFKDKELYKKFGLLIGKHAKFSDMSPQEVIGGAQLLMWFNGLDKHIDALTFEHLGEVKPDGTETPTVAE